MTNTRKMAYIAILSAVSFLLMYVKFPLLPGVSILEAEFSILPILIGMLVLDMKAAFAILLFRSLLKLLLNNTGPDTWIGLPMNIVAMSIIVLAFAFFWKKKGTVKDYLMAAVVATLGSTLVMLVLNFVYAIPAYTTFAGFKFEGAYSPFNYLVYMVLPFNLLQGVLLSVVFYFFYLAFKPHLRKI